jgi:hypothetical protein
MHDKQKGPGLAFGAFSVANLVFIIGYRVNV